MPERHSSEPLKAILLTFSSRGGLIWDHTLLRLLFGARDAHPPRREAVNANGKAENIRAATQSTEAKPTKA